MKALDKEEISKKIQKTSLPSVLFLALDKDPFAECHATALGKVFFGLQIFCAALFMYQELLVRI